MKRRIIEIDEGKCTGCRLCAEACHEGAIEMVGGKARLVRDDYCDGFGDCLPACPVGAISFVEREAAAYDEAAVLAAKRAREAQRGGAAHVGCPGSATRELRPAPNPAQAGGESGTEGSSVTRAVPSELGNWPVQIKLAPTTAPCFDGADLLVAADCTAFSYGDFHADFMRGRTVLIGCPKLDAVDYSEKLSVLFASNDIKSVTVTRMEVPCCGGLERATRMALEASGSQAPLEVVTITIDGTIKGVL